MKRPDFEVPSINTRYLTYIKHDRTFCSEVSSLPGNRTPMYRIYNDACDEGFYLQSHRTGDKILMVLEKCEEDAEGETQAWVFVPADTFETRIAKVILFND